MLNALLRSPIYKSIHVSNKRSMDDGMMDDCGMMHAIAIDLLATCVGLFDGHHHHVCVDLCSYAYMYYVLRTRGYYK